LIEEAFTLVDGVSLSYSHDSPVSCFWQICLIQLYIYGLNAYLWSLVKMLLKLDLV